MRLSGAFCSFRLEGRQPVCVSKSKNHSKIHLCQVHSSFDGAEMCPDDEKAAENTAVLSRALKKYGRISARQNRVCPYQLILWINKSIPALGCACVYATDEIIYIVTIGADFTYPSTGF